jgi:SPP1 gp7 family putative phage head morphogenesis protein
MAKANPQDKTLQKLAKQNIPKYKIDRLRALELDLQMQLTEATNGQAKGIYNTLDDVSKVSQATLASRMNKTLGLTFNAISSNKMKQILMSDWSGANWSERLWKDREKVGKKLTEVLEKGIPQGTSLQKMSRELRDLTGESFNNAFRLIRTETAFIDTQVTFEGFEQARQELGLEYYMYDAHLDSRTSAICREMDGKYFKIVEKEIGVNAPPLHVNCRSGVQLVLDDDDMKEPVKELTEFKDFGKFNRKAYGLASFVEANKGNESDVDFSKRIYDKNTRRSFINMGNLTDEAKKMLKSETNEVKLSIETMIKNRLHHKDLNFYDYQKIPEILNNPSKMAYSIRDGKEDIILFNDKDKYYMLVVKTTNDKKENYIKSFRRLNEEEYNSY